MPQDLNEVLYSWLFPEGLPFIISYLLLFTVFAGSTHRENSDNQLKDNETHFTKIAAAFVIVYACALGARVLWLETFSPSFTWSETLPRAAILSFSSVGTALIADAAQRANLRIWSDYTRWIWPRTSSSLVLWICLCIVWNIVIGRIYIQNVGGAKPGYMLTFVAFPTIIVFSVLVGAIINSARSARKAADRQPKIDTRLTDLAGSGATHVSKVDAA